MSRTLAFVGLGVMGYPMAGFLAGAGHAVTVFNRTVSKAQRWCSEYGGVCAGSAADAAADAEMVFMCVGDDPDVREVAMGDGGVLQAMQQGAVLVDHTTGSADLARELAAAAAESGVEFLDAPVSGGQAGAESGTLTVMVGGEEGAFQRAAPLIGCYAGTVRHLGPSGSGQLTKMVNQICIAGLIQSLAEGIAFAQHAGLDVEEVIRVISKGAAQSWQMENRWQTMAAGQFDFGFAVDWMRKDLRICMEEARRNGSPLPVAEIVDRFYSEIQSTGGGRWDTSSLITRLKTSGRES